MRFLYIFIWLFPVLFMFNDFEEIIMINPWKRKYEKYIEERKAKNNYTQFPFTGSTESFAIAVLIEFLLIIMVCILSCIFNNYIVWIGLFIGFVLHLFIHIGFRIMFRKYVPGFTSSIILIPICIWLLDESNILLLFNMKELLIAIVIASLFEFGLIFILHKLVRKFDLLIKSYSRK